MYYPDWRTGILNGIVQYLLLMALLILFRRPGVLSLFFLMRWLLSAILFGRVTLVGILICSVSIVVLEFVLWVWGFFKKEVITEQYAVSFIVYTMPIGLLPSICWLMGFYTAVLVPGWDIVWERSLSR